MTRRARQVAKADGSLDALRAAEELFSRMPRRQRDSYTYTVMMGLLGRAGLPGRALEGLEDARRHGIRPNVYMYNAAMGACAAAGLTDQVLRHEMWHSPCYRLLFVALVSRSRILRCAHLPSRLRYTTVGR
jgi:pentatricopeptide repeat protein